MARPGTWRFSPSPDVSAIATVIRGSGMHVPPGIVTNQRMSLLMDTSDEWIRQRTGIGERRYARKGGAHMSSRPFEANGKLDL